MKNKFLYLLILITLITLVIPNVLAITGSIENSRIVVRGAHVVETIERSIIVINRNDIPVNISIDVEGDLEDHIQLLDNNFRLEPGEEKEVYFTIFINESGKFESEILVLFTPSDGTENGVGLSSTIIIYSDILDIMKMSDEGSDEDGDGLHDYLIVNTEVYINESANYKIESKLNLFYSNTSSDYIQQESSLYLERGNHLIPINFSGPFIYSSKLEGPYLLELSLYNLDNGNVIIKQFPVDNYNYTDFERPIEFINFSDYGLDEDEDGLYDYLVIEAEVEVKKSGDYEIEAETEDLSSEEFIGYLEEGLQKVKLRFYGSEIYESGESKSHILEELNVYYENNELISLEDNIYTTSFYNYTEFEPEFKDIQANVTLSNETSKVIAGEEVKFIFEFKNIGNVRTMYDVYVSTNENWSSLNSIGYLVRIENLLLNPGESEKFEIVSNINDNASGKAEFTIKTKIYGDSQKEENFSFVIEQPYTDTNPPIIELISPSDYHSTTSDTITFRYVLKDESNITKCNLIIDGIVKESSNSIINNTENSFSYILYTGNYNWQIYCTDVYGNGKYSELRLLEIKKSSSSSSSSSSRNSYSNKNIASFVPLKKENENKNEQVYQEVDENNVITLGSSEVIGLAVNSENDEDRKINTNFLLLASIIVLFLFFIGLMMFMFYR